MPVRYRFKERRWDEQDHHFWEEQKKACEAFAADLERAGAKRCIGKPCEYDRPRLISARTFLSGCSSALGWD